MKAKLLKNKGAIRQIKGRVILQPCNNTIVNIGLYSTSCLNSENNTSILC